ncbi:DUF6482 family protein [Pontibacter sp. JAM-7]|uniref:DUF6482 family protein n=1 Tax=Pontibacter sp. JAM-7 TaxID=3366581 RepID=UPI003AF65079
MKLQFSDLPGLQPIERVTVHSIDSMIYQVSVTVGGKRHLLYQGQQPFRCHNLLQVKELFQLLEVEHYLLQRPASAYDEMVGQPVPMFNDAMETDLCWRQVKVSMH